MAKVSRESAAHVDNMGAGEERHEDIEGYSVGFVKLNADADLAPLLKGLPDDLCPCPHWGYVFKGKLTWRYADHEEVVEAGDAFYIPAGHSPKGEAGTEFVLFSNAEQMVEVNEAIAKNVAAMQRA